MAVFANKTAVAQFLKKIINNNNSKKMMRYEETEKLADTSACAGVRADLKMCLLESDCVKKVC